jgi:peptidoglycan/LPS O-acetylase OafA/YrhL
VTEASTVRATPTIPLDRRHSHRAGPRPLGSRPGGRRAGPPPADGARSWHRRDIEGLRAVAVLLVVAYHCGIAPITGGYVGVDVFFVISGFLITSLLLREIRTRRGISIPGFYARRALRLLPAATVVLVATVAAASRWLPPLRRHDILLDALHTMAYAINYRLAAIGTDYLSAEADPSPLQHFWSLAVEEQFYLVWPPLLLVVGIGWQARRPLDRSKVYAALTAVAICSFALSVWQTKSNASWAYFGAHTRAWELALGALVAVAAGTCERLPRRVAAVASLAGLAAIVGAAVGYSPATPFPGYAALLPVAGTAAVIVGGCAVPSRLLTGAPLQGIGRLSYSWYLWHWPFLLIAPAALGIVEPTAWQNALIAAAAFVAAMLTYALVENPVRRLAALRAKPWRGITAGLATSGLAAALCVLITTVAVHGQAGGTYRAPTLTAGTFDLRQLPAMIAAGAAATAVPTNLTPKLAKAASDKPQLYRDSCSGDFTDAEVKTPCAYGDVTSKTTVVLFGDSHAGHWFPALEYAAKVKHWKLVVLIKSACSAADALIYLDNLKRNFDECTVWRKGAWQRIRDLKPAAVVMVSVAQGGELDVPGDQDQAWTDAWLRSVDQVAASGAQIQYINDTPWHGTVVPDCLSAHLDSPQACARTRAAAILQPRRRQMIIDAVTARGGKVIDPLPWFCTATACPVIVGNILVYKDRHHMTTAYSRLLGPLLLTALGPIGA